MLTRTVLLTCVLTLSACTTLERPNQAAIASADPIATAAGKGPVVVVDSSFAASSKIGRMRLPPACIE